MLYDFSLRFSDHIGIFGVMLTLIGYYLLSVNKITAQTILYPALNLIGSILILFSLFFHWNTPSFLVELAWVFISMIGLYKAIYAAPRLTS